MGSGLDFVEKEKASFVIDPTFQSPLKLASNHTKVQSSKSFIERGKALQIYLVESPLLTFSKHAYRG